MKRAFHSLLHLAYFSILLASVAMAADEKQLFDLRSVRKSGQTDRVTLQFEVTGKAKYRDADKQREEDLKVVCKLDYHEKTLDVPANAQSAYRSARVYQKAAATVTVGDRQFEPTLRPEHHRILVEAAEKSVLLWSPDGNLTREELETIDLQGSSLLLDRLLPGKPVAVGDEWSQPEELVTALLGLDEVAKTTFRTTLKEVTADVARFELSGRVEGAVYGVSTEIKVIGKFRFNRHTNRIDWFTMRVKESRESSYVEDGVEVDALVQEVIAPGEETPALADAAVAKLAAKPSEDLTRLSFSFPGGGCRFEYDRRWYVHPQHTKDSIVILRLLDRGAPLGQCNITVMPHNTKEKTASLDEFKEGVKTALKDSFGEFADASESTDHLKHRVLRVAVRGRVHSKPDDLRICWIYYHVSDEQGRQLAMTFTVEEDLVQRFADADKAILRSLRLEDKKPAVGGGLPN